MKNTLKFIGFIALVAIMGFTVLACDTGGSTSDAIIISGTLTGGGGGSPSIIPGRQIIRSSSTTPEAGTQTFRAEVKPDNSIEGRLQDGSIIFLLEGRYDPVTKGFTMQAPSTNIIFSIAGKLNANNSLNTGSTRASVKVRDTGSGEWETIDLTLTSSNQTVEGTVNAPQSGVASIPAYCQGTWTDEIARMDGWSLRYIVTRNSITMLAENDPPQDLTVIGITPNNNDGPWILTIQGKFYYDYHNPNASVDYTGKFYINKTFSNLFLDSTNGIGNVTVDQYAGGGGDSTTLAQVAGTLSGIRMFVTPYGSKSNVSMQAHDHDDFSPLFQSLAAATAAQKLIAVQGFTLALK